MVVLFLVILYITQAMSVIAYFSRVHSDKTLVELKIWKFLIPYVGLFININSHIEEIYKEEK